ncbi:MAG TPA: discoidin domain-containing protein, partial [Candidatus Deferrimicrobiaceae bacterium]
MERRPLFPSLLSICLFLSILHPCLAQQGVPLISKTNWSLWYVDSEEIDGVDGAAENAFDGSAETFWHTQFTGGDPPLPHEIQINLGGAYQVYGFRYLPRQ